MGMFPLFFFKAAGVLVRKKLRILKGVPCTLLSGFKLWYK